MSWSESIECFVVVNIYLFIFFPYHVICTWSVVVIICVIIVFISHLLVQPRDLKVGVVFKLFSCTCYVVWLWCQYCNVTICITTLLKEMKMKNVSTVFEIWIIHQIRSFLLGFADSPSASCYSSFNECFFCFLFIFQMVSFCEWISNWSKN